MSVLYTALYGGFLSSTYSKSTNRSIPGDLARIWPLNYSKGEGSGAPL